VIESLYLLEQKQPYVELKRPDFTWPG
jgi:hypothetical protein